MELITDTRGHASEFTQRTDLAGLGESVALVRPLETGEDVTLHFGWVNPYDLIRGNFEVERWSEATASNINAGLIMFFACMAMGGGAFSERLVQRISMKREKVLSNVQLRVWSFAGAGVGIGLALIFGVLMGLQIG